LLRESGLSLRYTTSPNTFRVSHPLPANLTGAELEEIRSVVVGTRVSMPRPQAMALLIESDAPGKEHDFQAVLANDTEPIGLRLLAASHLGRIDTEASEKMLIAHADVPVESLRTVVMLALARIGRKVAQRALTPARESGLIPRGPASDFAAMVIAHRLGTDDHALSRPMDEAILEAPDGTGQLISVRRADEEHAVFGLRSLAREPVGVEFDESSVLEIRCGRRSLLLLVNRDLTGRRAAPRLAERPNILGALARLNQETGLYYPALLALTSPGSSGEFSIAIYRLTGAVIFRGAGHVVNDRALFSLHAIARPGALAIRLEGVLAAGTIQLTKGIVAVSGEAPRSVMTDVT
jgi:hypothetical protein